MLPTMINTNAEFFVLPDTIQFPKYRSGSPLRMAPWENSRYTGTLITKYSMQKLGLSRTMLLFELKDLIFLDRYHE